MKTVRKHQRMAAAITAGALVVLVAPVAIAAAAINTPPVAPHSIIVFPVRDFVSAAGYASADRPTIQILRGGAVVGTAANLVPQDDPATPGFDGLVEVNHPGGGCWAGVTPDIRPGDFVLVTTATGGDQTRTANVAVTQPATKINATTVVMKGTAVAAGGGQIPLDQLEARIVANKQAFALNGRRTIRAGAAAKDGATLAYDGPGLTTWTATWPNLGGVSPADGLSDADRATSPANAESRGMWLGVNPGTTAEGTIFESGQIGGPAAPCTAPLAKGPSIPDITAATDTGVSSTDNITRITTPTFTGAVALPDATNVNLYVDGVSSGTATVAANGSYSLTPTTALTAGRHSITASEFAAGGTETMSAGALTATIDTTGPVLTGKAPAASAMGASQTGNITASFNEAISGLSGASFTLKNNLGAAVAGAVSWNAATRVATMNPTATLAADKRHTAALTSGIKDLAGNPLVPASWAFTTGPRPVVTTRTPGVNTTGVSRAANVTATSSETVSGITGVTFALRNTTTGAPVSATVSYNPTTRVATLNPTAALAARTKYTTALSTGIRDAAGNPLVGTSWSFTTGP
jgi:hypothetical protein